MTVHAKTIVENVVYGNGAGPLVLEWLLPQGPTPGASPRRYAYPHANSTANFIAGKLAALGGKGGGWGEGGGSKGGGVWGSVWGPHNAAARPPGWRWNTFRAPLRARSFIFRREK